jgi:predicted transcriptional regulator
VSGGGTGNRWVQPAAGHVGDITVSDAREVEEVEREAFTVKVVMTRELQTATLETAVIDAFETMQTVGIGRLLVVDVGTRIGWWGGYLCRLL